MTRRMISGNIISSDAFLDMPVSTQNLYFHLIMNADDEGFVGNPKKVMRIVGCQNDDLKVLVTKRFVMTFESGIILIKHWLIHNTIRMDRFSPSTYLDEKNMVEIKENKAYTLIGEGTKTLRQPTGNQLATTRMRKLSKDKLSKDSIVDKVDKPFILKEEIQKLEENNRREMNIIALYLEHRKPDLQNRAQFSQALRRHLRPAIALKDFTDAQILKALDYAKKEYKDVYTLETLLKILVK